jgi:hypothetical protein
MIMMKIHYIIPTFSQRGSTTVNKSLVLALLFVTSAPPAFPNMISPAFFEAVTATSRRDWSSVEVGSIVVVCAFNIRMDDDGLRVLLLVEIGAKAEVDDSCRWRMKRKIMEEAIIPHLDGCRWKW